MIAFIVGLVVGVIYFGGLYLSVQKINTVKHPSLIMGLSFVLRMAILLIVFFFIAQNGIRDILLAFAAVMLVRVVMTLKLKEQSPNSTEKR